MQREHAGHALRSYFYSRPCGRGDRAASAVAEIRASFLLTPLREGRRRWCMHTGLRTEFLLTPLREGRRANACGKQGGQGDFYSRPCGRGDYRMREFYPEWAEDFYSRPCGRGDTRSRPATGTCGYFYSRPCGRGDASVAQTSTGATIISTHAPAGGATLATVATVEEDGLFLLTPLREGRLQVFDCLLFLLDFYSRPCGRGDMRIS